MRLKSLRKERPIFEIEGAVINGNRMDLSTNDLKPTKHRSNTSFALPTSLNIESSPINIPLSDRTYDMSTRSRQQIIIPTANYSSNLPSYQAIETAYLEHGIRIRLSPTRIGQQSGRKSATSIQRHNGFASRNPSRTSSVLHYTTTDLDQHHDSRPFSALQQTSSNDFEQTNTHNVSYAQSSQIDEEIYQENYLSPSIIASEHSNPMTPPEKLPLTNEILLDTDPDLLYMSTLLKKSSGDAFRDTIRRRAGLRGTFSAHRNPLTTISIQPQLREKSPQIKRNSLTHIPVLPTPSSKKINKDIIKHASRIRSTSQSSRDHCTKSSEIDTTSLSKINNTNKRNSINKSLSLKPLEFLLSPTSNSASLSIHDLHSTKKSSNSRKLKTSIKRTTKSTKTSTIENQTPTNNLLSKEDDSTSSSILHDESLSLMRTSPLNRVQQSNSFDSGCYDRSSSGGDIQSLTSSSIIHMPSSIPSARLTSSAVRRSNSNKKVSFYDEPIAAVLTTATYV